eukprot:504596-Amorphochlora_amoeboformis.AAC.1
MARPATEGGVPFGIQVGYSMGFGTHVFSNFSLLAVCSVTTTSMLAAGRAAAVPGVRSRGRTFSKHLFPKNLRGALRNFSSGSENPYRECVRTLADPRGGEDKSYYSLEGLGETDKEMKDVRFKLRVLRHRDMFRIDSLFVTYIYPLIFRYNNFRTA